MLSHAIEAADFDRLDPADFAAEWKWDGIRVQAVAEGGRRRLYSRTGDDISGAFPDLLDALDFDAAIDGELLVRTDDGGIAPFSELQQRLNRKTVTAAHLRRYPAHLRAYDLLRRGADDLRPLPFAERRAAPRGPRRHASTPPASTSRRSCPSPPGTTSPPSAPPRPTR